MSGNLQALAAADDDAGQSMAAAPPGGPQKCPYGKLPGVEFTLLTGDDEPVVDEPYVVTISPGGAKHEGKSDGRGRIRLENLDGAENCRLALPRLDEQGSDDEEVAAQDGRLAYVPGKPLDGVAVDRRYQVVLPGWDLDVLDALVPEPPPAAPTAAPAPRSAAKAEPDEDWEIDSLA